MPNIMESERNEPGWQVSNDQLIENLTPRFISFSGWIVLYREHHQPRPSPSSPYWWEAVQKDSLRDISHCNYANIKEYL